MAETIIPQKGPLFAGQEKSAGSFFQKRKKLLIIVGILLFIGIVVALSIYFLGSSYSQQILSKS